MLRLKSRLMRLLWRAFSFPALAFAMAVLAADGGGAQGPGHAVRLIVNGPIGPAVADYIHRGLEKAVDGGATVVILQMDTPGGLDTSMREIIKDILASPVPVIGYVGPSGARAASAGTYMLYASHVAAMAPATNLGAATPVQMGAPGAPDEHDKEKNEPSDDEKSQAADDTGKEEAGEDAAEDKQEEGWNPFGPKPGMEQKVMQDAVAYIKSLAQKRGRNAEWAVKAVTEAASLSAEDALTEGVINFIAESPAEVLAKADGMTVDVQGADHVMRTAGLAVVDVAPDWRNEFLEIITDPTVAYLLLFTIGIPALMIELYTGTMIAGVIAAISIVLGLYGLHVLPIDYAGAGLMLLGMALLIAEAFVPSFGALGLGGVVAFVIGSVMLIDTDVPGYGISPWVIGTIATMAGGFMLMVVAMFVRARSRPAASGHEAMLGKPAIVIDWSQGAGRVRFQGEVWQARGVPEMLDPGDSVIVLDRDGVTLVVGKPERKEGD
jgi:membrane-bound serine protease (ClpP class)